MSPTRECVARELEEARAMFRNYVVVEQQRRAQYEVALAKLNDAKVKANTAGDVVSILEIKLATLDKALA